MSKQLSDLFVVYRPKEIKSKKDSKNIYLPEGVYDWQNFLNNVERIQKSKFGQTTSDNNVERIEEAPFIFDWDNVLSQEYNDLWGFQPKTLGSDYLGVMTFTRDDTGLHATTINYNGPLNVKEVIKARNEAPGAYNQYKLAIEEYKKNNPGELSQEDWDMLEGIAGIESHYNINSESSAGALGWFQIMPSNIQNLGIDVQQFKQDPNLQIKTAINLYKYNKRQLAKFKDNLKSSGLTPFQATYMYWWGPKATEQYLINGKSSISDTDKNDIISILKKAS